MNNFAYAKLLNSILFIVYPLHYYHLISYINSLMKVEMKLSKSFEKNFFSKLQDKIPLQLKLSRLLYCLILAFRGYVHCVVMIVSMNVVASRETFARRAQTRFIFRNLFINKSNLAQLSLPIYCLFCK